MVLLALASIAALLAARPVAAGAGLVAAAAVKVSAILYAPFALVGSAPGSRWRLIAGGLAALAALAVVSLLSFGPPVSAALSVAGGNQGNVSHWSTPATLARITSADVDFFRLLLGLAYAVEVVGLLIAVARGFDWLRAAGWASFGLLVASAYVVPWYLIWLLPIAAISRDRILIGATILLTFLQVINAVPI
jgi:alpha-1,6-mannosyltransferase